MSQFEIGSGQLCKSPQCTLEATFCKPLNDVAWQNHGFETVLVLKVNSANDLLKVLMVQYAKKLPSIGVADD